MKTFGFLLPDLKILYLKSNKIICYDPKLKIKKEVG